MWAGYAAAAVGMLVFVPQLVKLFRDHAAAGVSVMSWLVMACAVGLWLTYAVRISSGPQIVANVLPLLGALWVSIVASRAQQTFPPLPKLLLYVVLVTAFWCVFAFVVPAVAAGWTAGLLTVASRVPQISDSVKTFRAGTVSDVSLLSAWLWTGAALLWTVYGLGAADMPVIWVNAVFAVANVAVIGLELGARRKARSTVAPTVGESFSPL